MGQTLTQIAQQLQAANKKVLLIYAFNGIGKTRLSREFKELVAPKASLAEEGGSAADQPSAFHNIIYYNAFTEDLFYWDNDLKDDAQRRLIIQPNSFTDWLLSILQEQGQDGNIVKHFQRYTNSKITPHFSEDFQSITFSLERGGSDTIHNLKISKGEESNFIWSLFYTFLEEVVSILEDEPDDRSSRSFDELEYIFIDDPVSSLDENHLIEIAVDLANLIKKAKGKIQFIVSTHNALFYNAFSNTLTRCQPTATLDKRILKKTDDGHFEIKNQDASQFLYHLYLKEEIEKAVSNKSIKKYHFNYLRNILEKTAIFLGHQRWKDILPDISIDLASYESRMLDMSSHSDYAGEEVVDMSDKAVTDLEEILKAINSTYHFNKFQ